MKEEKRRNIRSSLAHTVSGYCEIDFDEQIYRKIGHTIGVESDFAHPEIEALVDFSDEPTHSILRLVFSYIEEGKRFSAGDRIKFRAGLSNSEYTIEFRNSDYGKETYLRAVILGVDDEFQLMHTEDALNQLKDSPEYKDI